MAFLTGQHKDTYSLESGVSLRHTCGLLLLLSEEDFGRDCEQAVRRGYVTEYVKSNRQIFHSRPSRSERAKSAGLLDGP
jgi:hypothetical protein